MNIRQIIKFVLLISPLITLASYADEPDYYAVILDGHKIGHAVMTRQIIDNKVYTGEEMALTLSRMGVPITAQTSETIIETLDAKPLGFESKTIANGSASGSKASIDENGKMQVYVYAGSLGQTQTIDYPKDALFAEGALQYQKQRGLVPGDKFTLNCYVPSMLAVSTVEVQTVGPEQIDLFGRVVTATKQIITSSIKGQTITQTDYVNDDFKTLKSDVSFMGLNIALIACDKIVALSENDIYDMLDKMLINCPTRLPERQTLESVTYYLSPINNATPQIPSDDNQTVTVTDNQIIVQVTPFTDINKTPLRYTGTDPEILDALKPTPFIQSDNELIIDLAKQAVGETKDASIAVHKITKFVSDYITEKNLSVGYASAVEVAESKEGDCTEHAVLTAAICRAIGIPSRVAVGCIYVDQVNDKKSVMAGHAWTEAYICDKWIGLDAIHGFGPGHLKLAAGNGNPSDFLEMIGSIGNFEITKAEFKKAAQNP